MFEEKRFDLFRYQTDPCWRMTWSRMPWNQIVWCVGRWFVITDQISF